MSGTFDVRNAGDYPDDWCLLRHRLWPDTAPEDHRAELQDVCETGAGFIVHDLDGSAIGFAEVSLRRDYVNGCDTSPVAFLEGIYVEEAFRRQGVAALLVEQVTRWAIDQGVSELASDADIANLSSHRMHAALGFEETERVVYFRKSLIPKR
ncbi:GNAT family N-acetyltransferase [Rhizobium pusense]|uniref:Aminoglycoside N(6')-acetyltransferase type 1 n=1 Tax=Agrobacterium genomosp. 2 str. CFBP 5494 TaxID=1183436 RepID=A0A9W5B038_9HYPH|nr:MULTISPECIES: aminoglycoside 6'-N-acetyltransferase [Rhizobium/Agrobacterium group]HCJ73682.1 N-acetyltransferase [Agrobacterium sp.]MDH0911606.1 GNAT family N-acetyltransferase [Agrobacterium pusense]MDH1094827.1 GNAT family N-acetyltransferase [Agrobacterium pusense]MDH1112091.1 GNAT family N-acetyltransferase [Agrobacterium pusense]MDH2196121.1 GNAT family N-acetyltransferase [Agrobacterium pusense]